MWCTSAVIRDESLVETPNTFDSVRFDEAIENVSIQYALTVLVDSYNETEQKERNNLMRNINENSVIGQVIMSHNQPWLKSRVATTSNGVIPTAKKKPLIKLAASDANWGVFLNLCKCMETHWKNRN